MATVEGLNRRGSRYYLRVVIPEDLQHTFGKARVNIALSTCDRLEAVQKGHRLRAEWLEDFSAKRRALNPQRLAAISPELSKALADAARRRVLAGDQDRRLGKDPIFRVLTTPNRESLPFMRAADGTLPAPPERDPLAGLNDWEERGLKLLNTAQLQHTKANYARRDFLSVLPLFQKDVAAMGFTVDRKTAGLPEALSAYLAEYQKAWQAATQRDTGEVIETPTPPSHSPTSRDLTEPAKNHAETLMGVYGRWLKIKTRTKSSEQACKLAVEQCEQLLGKPLHIQSITRAQGDTFRAWLREPERGISPKTARDRFTAIKSLLVYAFRDLELIPKQPWEGLDIQVKKTATRRVWKDEELQTLFSQPLFQTYEIPEGKNAGSDAAYWIPLLGLYTGARIGELAQLRVPDITEEDGIPVLRITDEGEGQRVKTGASLRTLPIHPELVRLGLLDYAKAIQGTGHNGSLWPVLHVNSERPGVTASNWFGKYRKSIGLTEKYPDFHSFRHLVRTRMSKGKIPEKVQDAITGHETQGSTGTKVYQGIDLEDRQEAIKSLSYTLPTLPRVYTAPRLEGAHRGRKKSPKAKPGAE